MALQLRALTPAERATIEMLAQSQMSSSRLKTRARIVWLASKGEGFKDISKHLSISPSTVRQWVKKFNEDGMEALSGEIVNCPQCSMIMPTGAKFCRSCGRPLQEGVVAVASHHETSTLDWPIESPSDPPYEAMNFDDWQDDWQQVETPRRKVRWVMWSILAITLLIVVGAPLYLWSRSPEKSEEQIQTTMMVSRSYFGAMNFRDAPDGGAYLEGIYPPGSPADEAGLVGGDIVSSYDAHTVRTADELKNLVSQTAIGKTVQIVYIRDGETKTTKLTTTSKNEIDKLDKLYDERPGGKGFMGEGNDLERVFIQSLNIYGVQINGIRPNLPADKAGLLNGDIVIEFDGVPIRTRKELEMRVERAKPETTVRVVVVRGTQRLEFSVTLLRNY